MKTKRRRANTGMALGAVLVLAGLVLLTVVTLTNLSSSALRLTGDGRDKAAALSLSEAGVDFALDRITASVAASPDLSNSWRGTGGDITLASAAGVVAGRFNVYQVDPFSTNQWDVYSRGTASSGKACRVRARVTLDGSPVDDAALISNGNIDINGDVNVRTYASTKNNAHVRANRNITVSGTSAHVDGRMAAAGTVSVAQGVSTDPLWPDGQNGVARVPFYNEDEIEEMQRQWIARARTGTEYLSGIVFATPDEIITVNAPAYIVGDITLTGRQTLQITGQGPVYIKGDIRMSGNSRLSNAASLIVENTFTQSTGAGEDPAYVADAGAAPRSPLLVSLSPDPWQAIRLRGGATAKLYSLVYAVNGGITIVGNANVRGVLKAGSATGGIRTTGNYEHWYPDNAANASPLASLPAVTSWIEL